MQKIQNLLLATFFILGVAEAIAQNVPLDVYLCIDASGSIVKEGKLEARQEVIKLISGFEQPGYFKDDEDRVSILQFSKSAACTFKLDKIIDKKSFLEKCIATTNITDFEDPNIRINPQRTFFASLFERISKRQKDDFKEDNYGKFRRRVIIIVTDGEYEDGMSESNHSLSPRPPSPEEIAFIPRKPDCKEAVIFVMVHVSQDKRKPENVQNKWKEALANYPYIYLPLYDSKKQKGEEIRRLFEKLRDDRKIQFIFKDSRIYCFYYHNIPGSRQIDVILHPKPFFTESSCGQLHIHRKEQHFPILWD